MLSPTRSCSPRPYAGQCLSEDTHTGKGKIKRTYALEVLPICKDDLVWLPRATANSLGQPSQLALCTKVNDPMPSSPALTLVTGPPSCSSPPTSTLHQVSNVVHFVDPMTLSAVELQPLAIGRPFPPALSRAALVEFVLDIELREAKWRGNGCPRETRGGRDPYALADVTVAKRSDFGANDRQMSAVTHLGHLLKVGDYAWGYMVAASQLSGDLDLALAEQLPEVTLVKKSYSARRHRGRHRLWRLRQLQKAKDPACAAGPDRLR